MSNGEKLIAQILARAHIKFETEKSFTDLHGSRYRYDFYCQNLHGAQVIFEFNGRQHYEQVKKFHNTSIDFKKGQERDRRKISYALANKIKIYCIPFWEEENLKTVDDLCQSKFLAKTRWHNDDVWKIYKENKNG